MKFIFKCFKPGERKDLQMFTTKIKYPGCNTEEHIDMIIKAFLYQRIYGCPYCFDGFIAKYGRLPNDNDVIEITYSGSPHKDVEVINVDAYEMVYYSVLNWRLIN